MGVGPGVEDIDMRARAANLGEAIKIATEGLHSGEWDLFRGQTNSDWQVTSSAERLSETQREDAFKQFERFVGWAQDVQGMAKYFDQPDSLWAISQHYGLKTNFIDFSDDPVVAAFFASDMKAPPADGQMAAIVCLNSKDFIRFWEQIGPDLLKGVKKSSYPQLLRIDVNNLWRLQKQKGSFLWNPVRGIERFYDFDRIIFPYTANDPALVPREEIYPDHQSELEKLLTQFFMNEQLIEGNRFIESEMSIHQITVPIDDYDAASWHPAGVLPSPDWQNTEAWDEHHVEHSGSVLPGALLELDSMHPLDQVSKTLCAALSLSFIEANRKKALNIKAAGGAKFDPVCMHLLVCVRHLWNGMRTLPYTSSEIHSALYQAIELFSVARRGRSDHEALGPDSYYAEMGSNSDGKGAYSRGSVTPKALYEACNPAFLNAARQRLVGYDSTFKSAADETVATASLMFVARPWQRFTFSGLRKLMVEQLIPTQIIWRIDSSSEDNLRTVIYFSPKEFRVFGLA